MRLVDRKTKLGQLIFSLSDNEHSMPVSVSALRLNEKPGALSRALHFDH